MINAKSIKKNKFNYLFHFSICTIVNDSAEYEVMKKSFEEKGFVAGCEYLFADNTAGNQFDAYEAISHFLKLAKGEYILLIHQDVRAVDAKSELEICLQELNTKDKNWAICGNAGAKGYHEDIIYIDNGSAKKLYPNLPTKVNSLDENFLLIKASSNLTISPNLKGFHLYGTDLCIVAGFMGYSCYVIKFMVVHLSQGNIKALEEYKPDFIKSYGQKLKTGYIQTTCTQFYISNSSSKNKFFNSGFIFFIIKQFKRYPHLFKKMINDRKN